MESGRARDRPDPGGRRICMVGRGPSLRNTDAAFDGTVPGDPGDRMVPHRLRRGRLSGAQDRLRKAPSHYPDIIGFTAPDDASLASPVHSLGRLWQKGSRREVSERGPEPDGTSMTMSNGPGVERNGATNTLATIPNVL